MGDIQTRPFSKNYSGLINQSVIALGITVLCVGGQELMKRARRGKNIPAHGLGSRESWEFGYLYQGRSWARYPSPPSPNHWILAWVPQILHFSEEKMNRLRGVDAALYVRFLRGCFWFAVLHTLTTFPVLFPIHVHFSSDDISPKSMTRASISSLVETDRGLSLLWVHICLLFWITLSWMGTLLWICHGAFQLRAEDIKATAQRKEERSNSSHEYYPHPHPQYAFTEVPALDNNHPNEGLRLRTIMVSNVLPQLRDEKELKEYFQYYMSKRLEKPALGLNSTTQPGFINKSVAFLFNHAKRIPAHLPGPLSPTTDKHEEDRDPSLIPEIERAVICRKMTELASLLERREDILRLLETAHIKLAKKALYAVKEAMDLKAARKPFVRNNSRAAVVAKRRKQPVDPERGNCLQEGVMTEEERMEKVISVLSPFVEELELRKSNGRIKRRQSVASSKRSFAKIRREASEDSDTDPGVSSYPPATSDKRKDDGSQTIWDALLSLPRSALDAYQPLINLSHLFRGKTVPAIDYYTAKLNLLTSLITENRAKPVGKYDPVSTAFVTFTNPEDARRACKFLAVHPNNPLACMVTMAPAYQDLDWIRVMKSSYDVEFVKDWVVSLGVWAFTVFWIFPVSLFVGLVSIQNISSFWPGLKSYLDRHPWQAEVIQSFIPTLLVALLALLIPLILLLIAKKAHNITTLSAMHDRIMTRYYKFLVVNVLVFFCVGTAALQSVLRSVSSTVQPDVLNIVASSFPTAGPFYVGWLIFNTAMHGAFEIALLGLPLIMYPATRRQVTPRKRATGIRPRTLNFYYWLPSHVLVIHVLLLFAILNPFVLPFGAIYFFVETGVIKNQLIHVYAKNYEGNGKLILIRVLRYSLDGLILAQAVFLAYMVVLKKPVNVGLAAFLIVFTAVFKLVMTRMCREQFERDDMLEAHIVCGADDVNEDRPSGETTSESVDPDARALIRSSVRSKFTWRVPAWVNFSNNTFRHSPQHNPLRRQPNPFRLNNSSFSRLTSLSPAKSSNSATSPKTGASDSHDAQTDWLPSPFARTNRERIVKAWQDDDSSGPVVRHPPPPAWDDQTTADLPYDNPFYTRPISNYLWLPRNPCGVLNLDDTVDLKTSITVELSAAPLGTWTGVPQSESPLPMSPRKSEPSVLSLSRSQDEVVPEDVFDGTEEIDLPPSITRRIEAKEGDIEDTLRPRRSSTFSRRASGRRNSMDTNRQGTSRTTRRPSIATMGRPQPPTSFRSFSDGSRPSPRRSSSVMSLFGALPYSQDMPTPQPGEPGLRPDAHAQADFVAAHASSSRLSVNASRISLQPPTLKRAQNISAHQAIVHEVMAEEEAALVNRLEEEEAEAENATASKSWWTSWMYRKVR